MVVYAGFVVESHSASPISFRNLKRGLLRYGRDKGKWQPVAQDQ